MPRLQTEPDIVADCKREGRRVKQVGGDQWWCLFEKYREHLIWAVVVRPPASGKVSCYCVTDSFNRPLRETNFDDIAVAQRFIDSVGQ